MSDSNQSLIDALYAKILKIRMVEESIVLEYPNREMRTPTHLHIGQEAIPSAVCHALNQDDYIFGYYRSHGWYLAKGGNLDRMIAELFGKSTGCSRGYGGSMHLIDLDVGFTGTTAIVAGAMPHAVGAGFTFKSRNTQQVAITCFGDGATEEGLFQESLMFAALRKLPVLFICENNGLATNTLIRDRQPQVEIYKRAAAHGVAAFQVDGNNALEVHKVASEAVKKARTGGGPSFIECKTYRYLEHCGPAYDFHLGHRTQMEIEDWKQRDPLKWLESMVTNDLKQGLKLKYSHEISAAFDFARRSSFPTTVLPEGMSCL